MDDMAVLRTAVSGLGTDSFTYPPKPEEAIKLIAVTPTIIAYRYRRKQGKEALSPEARYGHVENYLYMLTGRQPSAAQKKALETYMILAMEHGMNASTFSARVTVSTESDLVSAVTAALGTMKGPLHGGAPSGVTKMLKDIGEKENAEAYLTAKLMRGERLMGFGHRVYKTKDPRAEALRRSFPATSSAFMRSASARGSFVLYTLCPKPIRRSPLISFAVKYASAFSFSPYLTAKLMRGERLMGFGHRVYKTKDPRAEALRIKAEEVAGNDPSLDLALYVEKEAIRLLEQYKPGRKLYTNVEFYAAAVMQAIDVDNDLFTPTFSASRMAGWCAHVLEQSADNMIYRPSAKYTGAFPETAQQL